MHARARGLWIAAPNTTGSREDGFAGELIQQGGYELLYLTDDPGSSTPFGVSGLSAGWNLIQRMPPTCADRVPYPGGGYGIPAKYELRSLDTFVVITLGEEPWDPPLACP